MSIIREIVTFTCFVVCVQKPTHTPMHTSYTSSQLIFFFYLSLCLFHSCIWLDIHKLRYTRFNFWNLSTCRGSCLVLYTHTCGAISIKFHIYLSVCLFFSLAYLSWLIRCKIPSVSSNFVSFLNYFSVPFEFNETNVYVNRHVSLCLCVCVFYFCCVLHCYIAFASNDFDYTDPKRG